MKQNTKELPEKHKLSMPELLNYRYICAEIDKFNNILNDLKQDRTGTSTGSDHVSSGPSDNTAIIAAKIVDLQEKIHKLTVHKNYIENYIESINKADVRYAMYAKFILGMSYNDISRDLRKFKIDVTGAALRKKVMRYIKES